MTKAEVADCAKRMKERHLDLQPYSRDVSLLCDMILALCEEPKVELELPKPSKRY